MNSKLYLLGGADSSVYFVREYWSTVHEYNTRTMNRNNEVIKDKFFHVSVAIDLRNVQIFMIIFEYIYPHVNAWQLPTFRHEIIWYAAQGRRGCANLGVANGNIFPTNTFFSDIFIRKKLRILIKSLTGRFWAITPHAFPMTKITSYVY